MAAAAPGKDPDPIVASYKVILKPSLPAHQKLLILQLPNKSDASDTPKPMEMRIKPKSGMVEVDIPLDHGTAYDRTKGMEWGAVLASSTKAKAGGSHGLAGGFGVGGTQNRGRAKPREQEEGPVDWSEAVRKDQVLRKQTLGGMYPKPESWDPKLMVGVFRDGNLHLTPITALVHLRPQLHHIDAAAEAERQKHREGAPAPAAGGKEGPTRAIHMTIKSAGADGAQIVTETMTDRLRTVQTEEWSRMDYHDEEKEPSWVAYEDNLILKGADPAGKGKGKEKASQASNDVESLVDKIGKLKTEWCEENILRTMSHIGKPIEVKAEVRVEVKAEPDEVIKGKGKAKEVEPKTEAPKRGRPRRSRASASGAGRGRGGRAKVGASKSTAMDID